MPKGIYAAASAMVVETRAQEVVARNLAHSTTTGYRQETALRTSFSSELAKQGDISGDGGAGVLSNRSFFTFAQGEMEPTQAPYDMALEGDGFLQVKDGNGRTLLTRAGHFAADQLGRLTTPEGWQVQGQGGPVTIPEGATRVSIGEDGRVSAEVAGQTQVVDQLRVVAVAEPAKMKAENGVYFDPGTQTTTDDASTRIRQGYLEKSNVTPVQELAQMIAVQRRYDAAQRALKEQANVGGNLNELLRGSS
jgi:flagellar basal-body rod protein FlgF